MTTGLARGSGRGRGALTVGAMLEAAGPVTPNIALSCMREEGDGGALKGDAPGPVDVCGVIGFISRRDKSGELIGSFTPANPVDVRGRKICMNSAERAASRSRCLVRSNSGSRFGLNDPARKS